MHSDSSTFPALPADLQPGYRFYPQSIAQDYVDQGLWTDQLLGDLIDSAAASHPDNTALLAHDLHGNWQEFTYAQLASIVVATADELAGQGIGAGDRVILQLPNVAEFVTHLFALFRLGAIPVFALPAHRHAELVHFITASHASHVITCGKFGLTQFDSVVSQAIDQVDPQQLAHGRPVALVRADQSRAFSDDAVMAEAVTVDQPTGSHTTPGIPCTSASGAARPHPQDLAFLQLSGGTTGIPKLIPRTHADYLYSVRRSVEVCELTESSRMIVALPVAHNFPMSSPGILGIFHAAGAVILARDPSPSTAFSLIDAHRATIAPLVPPLAQAWLQAFPKSPFSLESLEVLQVGGAKFAPEVARRVPEVLGCTLQQVFGMAEGLVNYTRLDDSADLIATTQGYPMSEHDRVSIRDEHGEEVPQGERGVLHTQGPYTIRAYLGGVSSESFTPDGFYCTGDVVRRTASGHLVVEGRVKDQINRGGEKISAEEIENHLLATGCADAAVVGIPDPALGEKTCAYIVLATDTDRDNKDFSPQSLRAFLASRGLATFKIPDQFVITDRFPTTGVGKISRRQLREQLAKLHNNSPSVQSG